LDKFGRSTAAPPPMARIFPGDAAAGRSPPRLRNLPFILDEEFAITQLDGPARHRRQGGRKQGFPRAQAKAGLTPGHLTVSSTISPSASGPPWWVHLASIAKNSSPRRGSNTGYLPTCPASMFPSEMCQPRCRPLDRPARIRLSCAH